MGYVVVAVMLCILVWALLQERERSKHIRLYARNAGFTYIGAALPGSFPFESTSVRAGTIRNAVAGDKDNTELVFFDCRIGSGKGQFSQTVVAVRGLDKGFESARFGPNLTTERVANWTLIYRYKKLLRPQEIEDLISGV